MLLCARYVLPITSEPLTDAAVLVKDGKICDIGSAEILKLRYPDEEVFDYGQAALMPGLIDLQTRLAETALRGLIHDVPYATWIADVNRLKGMMDREDLLASAIMGGCEALSNGITTVADVTTTSAVAEAVDGLGIRAVLYREACVMDKSRISSAFKNVEAAIEEWRGMVNPDLVTIGVAAAPLYLCNPAMFPAMTELANKMDLPVLVRVAGTQEEIKFIRYGSSELSVHAMESRGYVETPPWLPAGCSPVRYLLNWQAFDADNVMAAHCVHLDEGDLASLKQRDVSVAICSSNNAQLGMGAAPMGEFRRAGLRMGLCTGAPSATSWTDMLYESRLTLLLQRALNVGNFIDSSEMIKYATIEAARALKIDDKVGSLEVDKRADIIAVDLSGMRYTTAKGCTAAIVNTCNGEHVLMTMVDGVKRYERGTWNINADREKSIVRIVETRDKLEA